MFIAQPAEEIGAGAMAMLATACSRDFQSPMSALPCMTAPFAHGTVNYRVGVGSSNADGLYIKFRGRGGHGAMPQATIDPVMMASRFIVDVQSVISREKDPTEFGVVSIGSIHAGTAGNIIPDDAMLLGTIRTFKPEVRAKMHAGIERTAKAVAAMSNAPAPRDQDHRGHQSGDQRCARGRDAEKVLKAAFGDKFRTDTAGHAERGFFRVHQCRRALDVLQYRRLRSGARGAARKEAARRCLATIRRMFAPVPKPTIKTGVKAMTLAVLSAFDQHARGK